MKQLLIVLLLLSATLVEAQSNITWAHFDKSFYVSGEVIWYKLYFPAALTEQEIAVQVFIRDKSGATKENWYLKKGKQAFVSGYYKIPYDWPSGWYQITFTAKEATTNALAVLADLSLPIYNDLEPLPENIALSAAGSGRATEDNIPPSNLQIDISPSKQTYQARESAEFSIQVKDNNGNPVSANISVAVTDASLTHSLPSIALFEGNRLSLNQDWNPKIGLQSFIVNSKDVPLQASQIAVYTETDTLLQTVYKDKGVFKVDFPDFYGAQQIQFINYFDDSIRVRLNNELPAVKLDTPLPYSAEIQQYLDNSRLRKKIYQAFSTTEMPLAPVSPPLHSRQFSPDRTIVLSDYENFATIPAMFVELSTPLKFKEEKGKLIAQMFNPSVRSFYLGPPIFIVDGQITRNSQFIASLDITSLEKIELFYDQKKLKSQFGALGLNGVAILTTSAANLELPPADARTIFSISGFQPTATFPIFSATTVPSETPLLRPQLLWEPSLSTNANGAATLRFSQSDDTSTFQVTVVAQSADGRRGYATYTYEVKL